MRKSNDYLTLEQSSQMLGRSVSFLKAILSRGEIRAKLAGGQWLIAAKDLEKLRENLSPQLEKNVHNFLPKRPSPEVKQKPKPILKDETQIRSAPSRNSTRPSGNDLKVLDTTARSLASNIEVHLAFIAGGKAIWNKIKRDRYKLNSVRRETLPEKTVLLLEELQKTKQKYILMRKTDRYKRLLLSMPEWDIKRIERKVTQALRKANKTNKKNRRTLPRTMVVEGMPGYYVGGKIGYYAGPRGEKEKRYWWDEED